MRLGIFFYFLFSAGLLFAQVESDSTKALVDTLQSNVADSNQVIHPFQTQPLDSSTIDRADKIIDFAKRFLGVPYKWAGSSPVGFDCSGFVQFVLKKYGVDVSRTSRSMATEGKRVPLESVREGDLLFFTGSNRSSGVVGHVGIVIENEDGIVKFIHSANNGGVQITTLNNSRYYMPRFLMARRIE